MGLQPFDFPGANEIAVNDDGTLRTFDSGATRDTAENKLEPWGFTSALAEQRFCEYMHAHRTQSDGSLRDSDNWKRGFGEDVLMHSLSRHILDLRLIWEGHPERARTGDKQETLCAIIFNATALLREDLHGRS